MRYFLISLLTLAIQANGQKARTFYDYKWRPCAPGQARFVSEVIRTDSGWLRNDYYISTFKLQMTGLYEDSTTKIANGYFHYFYGNGILEEFEKYVHNKPDGLRLYFYQNGALEDSTVYHDGNPVGISLGWHFNGYQEDSINYRDDGTATEVQWFSNGNPSAAGRWKYGKRNGPWLFFHNNGKVAAKEIYDMGKLVNATYFSSDGMMQDSAVNREMPEFPGGEKGWSKFVYKHLYFPDHYRITNADTVTVVVAALIDENGNVQEPFVKVPFNKAFDDIALSIFRKSPKWLPAMQHNHAIIKGILLPVTFTQRDNQE